MKNYNTKSLLSFLIILFFSVSVSAQSSEHLWTKTTKGNLSKAQKSIRKTEPTKAAFYKLDINGLKSILQNAPKRKKFTGVSNVIISFPNADGSLEAYRILEASVMDETLQEKHPNIRSYVGQSIENPSTIIRFSITPQGLHTMILSSSIGTQFIDPYTKNGNSYIVYAKRDLPSLKNNFICEVIDKISANKLNDFNFDKARNANDGKLRTFRLALASTIEYSQFHWEAAGLAAGDTEEDKKDAVLDAMVVTMTRVNGVYEKDLSITMTLIANNKDIIFIGTDPFTPPANNDGSILIGQSQTQIDAAIGSGNYDIGHTFSTGAGGVASLAVPCLDGSKARGVTGLSTPVGDPYDIDFVAHEMGHQFGANHTFNGDEGSCAGSTRVGSNAYEVGSGSTIMAYAGICSPQNVQNNSDAYFHQASLAEIWANVTTGNSQCGAQTSNGNAAPMAMAGLDYTIPISTPYKLTGASTDTDGTDSHTFTWEQYDLGDAGLPTEGDLSGGPLVRTYEGTTNPIRYIPRLTDVISNGGISTTWEKLASVSRDINFQLTVRDNGNVMAGGQTDSDGMIVTTDATAGPFIVTSQNTDQLVFASSASILVEWDVASTDVGSVNTDNVNILLSIDGGLTFSEILESGTANDGSQMVSLPNIEMPYCRIMVEGAGNIFYALNTKSFAVGNYTYEAIDVCDDYLFNANIAVDESPNTYTGYGLTVDDSVIISDIDVNVNITHNDNSDLFYGIRAPSEGAGIHELASGICSGAVDVDLTFDDEGSAVNCSSTNNGDNVIPDEPLSAIDGLDSVGQWVFFIFDNNIGDGDIATWNTTTLTICHSEFVPTLGVDDFSFKDSFLVFPNPNNGEFTVKLNSNSNNRIKINVFDIRGRKVFDNSYNNSSNFNEVINLGNVQSGIYLLNVSDGIRSTTKKIIVN